MENYTLRTYNFLNRHYSNANKNPWTLFNSDQFTVYQFTTKLVFSHLGCHHFSRGPVVVIKFAVSEVFLLSNGQINDHF